MLALLLQAAVPPAPPPPDAGDDVVVIGERLKKWTGQIKSNPLGTQCRTTVSTGDAEIDAVGCAALSACWTEYRSQIAAVRDDKAAAIDARRARMGAVEKAFGACLTERRDRLVTDLVDRHHAAEGKGS